MRIALNTDFDIHVIRGQKPPEEVTQMTPGLNLLRGFRELGVTDVHLVVLRRDITRPVTEPGPLGTIHLIPSPRFSGSATFYLWRRRLIHDAFAKIKPDIVHGHGTEGENALAAVTAPYPNVITLHGIVHHVHAAVPPPLLSTNHVARWLETFVVRKASDVICISGVAEGFLKKMNSPARCHFIPNAMAPCFFTVQPQPRPDDVPSLLFVGSVIQAKGVHLLVEALAGVQRQLQTRVRLRIVGRRNGSYEMAVRQQVETLNLTDAVEWLGPRNEEGVASELARTDVLVLPSFCENMPMCVGEAMAAGVPVVASTVGGIPEMIEQGEMGLLVPPGNSGALAKALSRLLSDAALRQKMGERARAKALREYAPRVVAEKTLAVYGEIVR